MHSNLSTENDLHPDLVIEMKSHSNLSFDMDFQNCLTTYLTFEKDIEKDWHSDLYFQKDLHSNLYIDQAWQIVKQLKKCGLVWCTLAIIRTELLHSGGSVANMFRNAVTYMYNIYIGATCYTLHPIYCLLRPPGNKGNPLPLFNLLISENQIFIRQKTGWVISIVKR